MSRQITKKVSIEVEIDFKYLKGTDPEYNSRHGNYLPGDPTEINDIKVFIANQGKRIEITKFLGKDEMAEIETLCWDSVENET